MYKGLDEGFKKNDKNNGQKIKRIESLEPKGKRKEYNEVLRYNL